MLRFCVLVLFELVLVKLLFRFVRVAGGLSSVGGLDCCVDVLCLWCFAGLGGWLFCCCWVCDLCLWVL